MSAIETILQAARRRFADYGPNKTSMAEIAADSDMSVGNLYRHFKNKEAIIVACMEQHLQQRLDAGIAAAASEPNALKALRAFLQRRLAIGHAHFVDTRHLFDLMMIINQRHLDILLIHENRVVTAIAALLDQGVTQHLFSCPDPQHAAYDIHQATMRYNHPMSLKNNPLDRLASDLNRLIDLFYQGLRAV
ncbi:MAG: TetR/AcrR family transcriptional regulator [Mariprofundales bacterium]